MYNGIQKIEEIIEYIEANITSEIDYEEMASKMTLSVYEFRSLHPNGFPLTFARKYDAARCKI